MCVVVRGYFILLPPFVLFGGPPNFDLVKYKLSECDPSDKFFLQTRPRGEIIEVPEEGTADPPTPVVEDHQETKQ